MPVPEASASRWPTPPQPQSGPVHVHRDVAELAGHAVGPHDGLAAADGSTTDARRDGQVDEVVRALPCPEVALAQDVDVGVLADGPGQAERLADGRRQGEAPPGARRLGGSMSVPVAGSRGPGAAMPTAMGGSPPPARCSSRAARSRPRQYSTTAGVPALMGVEPAWRVARRPSGVTTAARALVPPRSRARTGPRRVALAGVGGMRGVEDLVVVCIVAR